MNQEHKNSFLELLKYVLKEHEQAIEMCMKIVDLADTWDDLYDKDKEVPGDVINKAFVSSFFELQNYSLWFSAGINHHVLNVYLRWRDASIIESSKLSTDDDLAKSYMLRAGLYDIFVVVAYHLYGDDWAKLVGVTVRKFYGETLDEYKKEMRARHA